MGDTQAMSDLIDALGAAALDAKRTISEARQATADAKRATRELSRAKREMASDVATVISEEVEAQLRQLGPGIAAQCQRSYKKVQDEIDRLVSLVIGKPLQDGRSLQQMIDDGDVHVTNQLNPK